MGDIAIYSFDIIKFMDVAFLSSMNIGAFAWIMFLIVFIVWVIISIVLLYHWRMYGLKNKVVIFVETVYIVVSIVVITGALVSLLLI